MFQIHYLWERSLQLEVQGHIHVELRLMLNILTAKFVLFVCKSHTVKFSSNDLITCYLGCAGSTTGTTSMASSAEQIVKGCFSFLGGYFSESSNLEEAVLVITKRKGAMGHCSPPNYIFKAPFLESVLLHDFLWPPSVAHCVPVSRLIQNTFVLACIINLHSFTLWQQGIQSTCALCQPPPSPFVWDCDTKKLSPCVFITITSKETTNLIEYVIAPGI